MILSDCKCIVLLVEVNDDRLFNARESDFMMPASKPRVGNSLKYIESRVETRLYINNLLISQN